MEMLKIINRHFVICELLDNNDEYPLWNQRHYMFTIGALVKCLFNTIMFKGYTFEG